jgi:hypothetical protein
VRFLAPLLLVGCGSAVAIRARVVVEPDGVTRDRTIVVRGGRIAEIGPLDLPVPGAEVIEAGTVVALEDSHVHFCLTGGDLRTAAECESPESKLARFRRLGITPVSQGDDPGVLRRLGVRGAGRVHTRGHPSEVVGFERAVTSDFEPLDHLKAVPCADLGAWIARARERGVRSAVHVDTKAEALEALRLGADEIHHVPDGIDDELMAAMKGRTWVPTLALRGVSSAWLDRLEGAPAFRKTIRPPQPKVPLEIVRKAHAAGVRIRAGSDAGAPGVLFGFGLLLEIELLAEAIGPVDAIRCAARPLRVGDPAVLLLAEGDATKDVRVLYRRIGDPEEPEPPPEWAWIGEPLEVTGRWTLRGRTSWGQLVIDRPGLCRAVRFRARGRAPGFRVRLGLEDGGAFDGPAEHVPLTPEWRDHVFRLDEPAKILTVRFEIRGKGEVAVELDGLRVD